MTFRSGVEWPDWSAATAVIVGTGPSAAAVPLALAKGRARFIVIKSAWKLAPWSDVLYGIDRGWWLANQGAPGFGGLKVSPSPTVCHVYPEVMKVRVRPRADLLLKERGTLGCGLRTGGGFSGFQAINLAVQLGTKRLVLAGFDMNLAHGAHWNDDYRGVGRPDADRMKGWRDALDDCAQQFVRLGIEVLNASPGSALRRYRQVSFAEIFAD